MDPARTGLGGISHRNSIAMLAFNFGLSLLAGLLFGLIPAMKSTRTNLHGGVKGSGQERSAGVAHAGLRKGLVVAEMALTMVVLVAAGLFARSLYNLRRVDVGLRTERLIAFSISPKLNGYNPARSIALFGQFQESLAAAARCRSRSAAEVSVFSDSGRGSNITVEGYVPAEGEDTHSFRNSVTPGYFATLGVPLVAGREFTGRIQPRARR